MAAVHSKAVVLMLLIHCLLGLPFCGVSVFGPCFVIQYFVSFYFCRYLDREERAGFLTLICLLMMSCDC